VKDDDDTRMLLCEKKRGRETAKPCDENLKKEKKLVGSETNTIKAEP